MAEFEDLYNAYFSDIYRYIRRLSNNEEIAEEITSECFFKALQSIDKFRGECDIRVWLCQIAKNCYFTYLKKQHRSENIDHETFSDIEDTNESIEELIVKRDSAFLIRKYLYDIPNPYKEVFMWRVFAELSFKQIGQLFGKTDNWACVTYHRARTMIKNRMEENGYEK